MKRSRSSTGKSGNSIGAADLKNTDKRRKEDVRAIEYIFRGISGSDRYANIYIVLQHEFIFQA
jgi:hypothetical protein